MKNSVGLAYIQTVLQESPKELLPTQVRTLTGNVCSKPALLDINHGLGDGDNSGDDPTYDEQASTEIRKKLESLAKEIEEAVDCNDLGRVEKLAEEKETILGFWERAKDIRGHPRKLYDPQKQAYDAVRKAIKRAIFDISRLDTGAGHFLKIHIRITGRTVSYTGPEVSWKFDK